MSTPTKDSKQHDAEPEGKEDVALKDLTEGTASSAFEELLHEVDNSSTFQWRLWALIGIGGFFTGFHNMGAVFLGATPDHSCSVPHLNGSEAIAESQVLKNFTTPWVRGKKGSLEPSKCRLFNRNYSMLADYIHNNSSNNESWTNIHSLIDNAAKPDTFRCDSWWYDKSDFQSTVVTEWDLVCGRRWMMSSIQASYMMGILTGAVIFSGASDRIGRRKSSLIAATLFFISTVATSFSNSFLTFLILRFVIAGSGQGMVLVTFTLLMECVSLKGRINFGISYHAFFATGVCFLSLIAYIATDWRTLQLVIGVPTVILIVYYWLLPESPRWLLMQNREAEGVKALESIAKTNKKSLPSKPRLNQLLYNISREVQNKPTVSLKEKIVSILNIVVTLVRTPNLRRRNLIIFYAWFVTSMVYYGLTFSGTNLNASLFVTVALSGATEIPAQALVILLSLWFERKTILSLTFFCGGVACIAIIFVPAEMVQVNLALASFGKFTISGSFALVFVLSTELVPTSVRNISLGISSMCARIGSGIAPFIVDLLGNVYYAIPSTIFGGLALVAGGLSLMLPDTGKKTLPDTVEEIEAMSR